MSAAEKPKTKEPNGRGSGPRPLPGCPGLESCEVAQRGGDHLAVFQRVDERLASQDSKLELAIQGMGHIQAVLAKEMFEVKQLQRQTLDEQQTRLNQLEAQMVDEREQILAAIGALQMPVHGGDGRGHA